MKTQLKCTLLKLTIVLAAATAAMGQDAPEPGASEEKAATLPAGAKPWSEKDFVHPPLKCMEGYVNITEYPMMAWCFHGRGCPGYNAEFVKQAEMAGFNTLIDVQLMLKPAEKFENMMVMAPAFKFPPQRLVSTFFKPYPNHPRLIGVILDDNCPGIYPIVRHSAKWVKENHPHIVPYISENPRPDLQKDTPMRILGTQNYQMDRGRGVIGYCERLNYDRWFGNNNDMSFWPIYAAPIGFTAYRFQVNAALAYGAQGMICFAYAPGDRWPEWKAPDGKLCKIARPVHMYARKVAGRHIWGTRCLGVFHSAKDHVPRGDGKAALDKIVQEMDANLLAGFLVPEADFKDWKGQRAPDYAMVVDKRASKRWSASKPRDVKVSFHPLVTHAEVFPREAAEGPVKIRPIEPGVCVPLHLDTGDGFLLRLNSDLTDVLGSLAEPYVAVCRQMTDLAFRARVTRAKAAAEAAKREAEKAEEARKAEEEKAAAAGKPKKKRGKPKAKPVPTIPEGVEPLSAGAFQEQIARISQAVEDLVARADSDQSRDTISRLKAAVEYLKGLDPAAEPKAAE